MKININDVKIYIVHYKKLTDRKEKLENWFKDKNIIPIWVEGAQREDITQEIINTYCTNQPNVPPMNLGEIGCTLGHLIAYKHAVDNNHKYIIILEDDCIFHENFIEIFNNLFENCPDDFDVISLGTCCGIKHPNATEIFSFHKINPPRGRCGYAQVISNEACKKILERSIPFFMAADWMFYNIVSNYEPKFNIYWIEPPIAYQGSEIGDCKSSIR